MARGRRPRVPAIAEDNFASNTSNNGDDVEILPNAPRTIKSRADWSEDNTEKLCMIWCNQIDIGNCTKGTMTMAGMREVIRQYTNATGKVHDREQIMFRYRQLKALWQFIKQLKTDTGLGRNSDGTVIADDEWWESKTKGKANWKKLKRGWPHYMPQLEQMFEGVAVDGSTAYVPSANEEFEEEEEPSLNVQTPVSSNSNKRASTASTCASSPNKKSKSKSQAIKLMDKVISEQTRIGEDRNKMMERHVEL
ncbi:uncharacterized protein [Miscanthus floridulus]|uniref:uncharacterized protein n=1 Tax=Miscanthus floridulus TaxID=154761 RepID=UPI00345905C7